MAARILAHVTATACGVGVAVAHFVGDVMPRWSTMSCW